MENIKIGFVGIGKMGGPIATRLVNAGYKVTKQTVLGSDGVVQGKSVRIVVDLSTTGARMTRRLPPASLSGTSP